MANEITRTIKTQILLRSDLAANWLAVNPKLGQGEIAISIDLNQFKIGDGTKTWSELSYFEGNLKDTVAQLVRDVDAVEDVLNDKGEGLEGFFFLIFMCVVSCGT